MLRENWNYAQTVQGRCAVSPSHSVRKTETERLSGQPASPMSGEVRSSNAGARTEEMMVRPCVHRRLREHEPWSARKSKPHRNPKASGERKVKILSSV